MNWDTLIWVGIAISVSQSAMFSGLNLAIFSVSRLRLEIEANSGSRAASTVLALRENSNFTLTTILWGNVAVNVLLTLLSDSVLTGITAFLFSTFLITIAGEILPQAYFSRNALRMASALSPLLLVYQKLFYPVAKPSAMLLDWWLGPEGAVFFRERDFREVIKRHIDAADTDMERLEGIGALNFLDLDDIEARNEGVPIDPDSVISLPVNIDMPIFPAFEASPADPFLIQIEASGRKWVIVTDPNDQPRLVIDTDSFLRAVLFDPEEFNPYAHCHRPIIARDDTAKLGEILWDFRVQPGAGDDDVIDRDLILVWGSTRRVITGADLLGRLMRGIASPKAVHET